MKRLVPMFGVRPRVAALVVTGVLVCAGALVATGFSGEWTSTANSSSTLATRGPLRTAILDGESFNGPEATLAFKRTRQAGASLVRLMADWSTIAPATRPPGFAAASPTAAGYDWRDLDRQVIGAERAGLQPIVDVLNAPAWAAYGKGSRPQDGPVDPSSTDFAQFATAIAKRYSGSVQGLPRVRYWQVWNEPNVSIYLMPQYRGADPVSAHTYGALVNAAYDAVHAVKSDNVVIAGGLSPFSVRTPAVDTVGPLAFMRKLLCVSGGRTPLATCGSTIKFDAWSVHPYTSGGPTHHAYNPNDVSLGDLPKVTSLLRAALRLGHVRSSGPLQFWVTEFSWDTDPPDRNAVPVRLQARWVAEALYHAWKDGVSEFTWFTLRDEPLKTSDFQSGLYYRGKTLRNDRAKPTLTAFAFPFVAYRGGGGDVSVWGRTPAHSRGRVTIERRAGNGWKKVDVLGADQYGIFQGSVRVSAGTSSMRATSAGRLSLTFSLTPPVNENMTVTPFGVGSKK